MLINKFECKPTCAGKKIKKVGHLDMQGDTPHVVFDEEKDLHAVIQSYASQCKIENIIARYVSGDSLALIGSRGEGIHIDKETAEALQREPIENAQILSSIYDKQYNDFPGKDNISKKDFIELLKKGKYGELEKYVKKEEAHE